LVFIPIFKQKYLLFADSWFYKNKNLVLAIFIIMMQLNLPVYPFRIKTVDGRRSIFDTFRKRWVALTPEEWVRQHFVRFLAEELGYPVALIAVERSLKINQHDFRADVVVFSRTGNPLLVVECKAPEVKIGQQVFDQVARYNLDFQVDWLVVTNGLSHYCCRLDRANNRCIFAEQIPYYETINQSVNS
jgi:hypothetical protein